MYLSEISVMVLWDVEGRGEKQGIVCLGMRITPDGSCTPILVLYDNPVSLATARSLVSDRLLIPGGMV